MIASTLSLLPTGRPTTATPGVRPDATAGAASFALLIGAGEDMAGAADAAAPPGPPAIGLAASGRQADAATGNISPLAVAGLPDAIDPRWLATQAVPAAATTSDPTVSAPVITVPTAILRAPAAAIPTNGMTAPTPTTLPAAAPPPTKVTVDADTMPAIDQQAASASIAAADGVSAPVGDLPPAATSKTERPDRAAATAGRKRATARVVSREADATASSLVTTALTPVAGGAKAVDTATADPATTAKIAAAPIDRSEARFATPAPAALMVPTVPIAVATAPATSGLAAMPAQPSQPSDPSMPATSLAIAPVAVAPIAAATIPAPTVAASIATAVTAADAPPRMPARFTTARGVAATDLPFIPPPTGVAVATAAEPAMVRRAPMPATASAAAISTPADPASAVAAATVVAASVIAAPGPFASRLATRIGAGTPTPPALVAATPLPITADVPSSPVATVASTSPTAIAAALSAPIVPAPVDSGAASLPPIVAGTVAPAVPLPAVTASAAPVASNDGPASVSPALPTGLATTVPVAAPTSVLPTTPAPAIAAAGSVFADAIHAAGLDRPAAATSGNDSPLFQAMTLAAATPADSVAATTRHDQPTLDLRHNNWPGAMIEHIEKLRDAADASDTRIRIVPDALGGIDVAVRRGGDGVQVTLTADQPATRAMLAEARPQLTQMAEARGIRLADTQVAGGAGGGASTADGWRQPQAQPQATPRAPAPAMPADDNLDTTADATSTRVA